MTCHRVPVARSISAFDPQHPAWVRTDEPLFRLTWAGHEFQSAGYYFNSTLRKDAPHIVLQLTLGGAGFFEKQRRRTVLYPGMAFLHKIPGDFCYGYAPESQDDHQRALPYELVFVSITFDKKNSFGGMGNWYQRLTRLQGHVLDFRSHFQETIGPLMLRLAEDPPRDRYLASALIYQLLMTILSTLNKSRLADSPLVNRAAELLHAHAADPKYSIVQLARGLDCSREHLTRQFRRTWGVTPTDYLMQQRLRLVTQALRNTNDKLELVAQRTGFAGANYLCRAFRRHIGVSPAEFRRRPWLLGPPLQ